MKINNRNIELSHTDKVLFSGEEITKGDIIAYYRKITPVIMPHIEYRPLTLHRFPNGIEKEGFYQQEASDYFPRWIEQVVVEKREGGEMRRVLCNNKETLVYLANQACITPHIWLSRTSDLEKPDKMIFDLDPSNDHQAVVKAAKELKKLLDQIDLKAYLMTTGSRGLHVVIPIVPERTFDEVRDYAKRIAETVAKDHPDDFTTEHRIDKREGRVFIDYLRNAYGQTSVAPYSIRSIPSAPVATPLDWEELAVKNFDPQAYNIMNIFRRLGQKEDPWKAIYENRRSIKETKI